MRQALILILMTLAGGCAVAHHCRLPSAGGRQYVDAPAVALAFTPAVAAWEPPIMLWRDERTPGAFVGYEDLSTSFIYSLTDDHQTNDGTGYYSRRTIIEKTGVSYR